MLGWFKQSFLFQSCNQCISVNDAEQINLQPNNKRGRQTDSSFMLQIDQSILVQKPINLKSTYIGTTSQSLFSGNRSEHLTVSQPIIKGKMQDQRGLIQIQSLGTSNASNKSIKKSQIIEQDKSSEQRMVLRVTQNNLRQTNNLSSTKIKNPQQDNRIQQIVSKIQKLSNKYYWIDPNIYGGQNQRYLSIMNQVSDIDAFSSYRSIVTQLAEQPDNFTCQVICAASLSDQDYKQMQQNKKISRVILFCRNQERAQLLMQNFRKIQITHYKITSLIQEIQRQA